MRGSERSFGLGSRKWVTDMKRLFPIRPTTKITAFPLTVFLVFAGCQCSYNLEGDSRTPQDGKAASTDGSWTARLGELILPLFEEHQTEWAPDFDEDVFKSLGVGTLSGTVEEKLGSPLEVKKFSDGNVCWYYTRPGEGSDSYFVRVLEFGADGRLAARRRYFYVD